MRIRLDIPLSVAEIEKAIGAAFPKDKQNGSVEFITTDSRTTEKGDLFFALNSANSPSNEYSAEALKRGATVITEKSADGYVTVKSSVKALGSLAEYYKTKLKSLKCTVMITGSVGKSTTKEFCTTILNQKYRVHSNEGNLNNLIGLPLSVFRAKSDTEILILEAGMSSSGEISSLSTIATPDIGIITNIGTAHIGILGSRENIAKAKCEIRDGLKNGLLLTPLCEPLLNNVEALRVGFSGEYCDYSILLTDSYAAGSYFSFLKSGSVYLNGRLNIGGAHFLEPLSFALSVADILHLEKEEILRGVALVSQNCLRAKHTDFGSFKILDDSYNSSPESVIAALKQLALISSSKKSALLGDMLELGEHTESEHERIGTEAAMANLNALYLYGEYSEYVMYGALRGGMDARRIFINKDILRPDLTAEQIISNHTEGETILFKASHALNLSRISDIIRELTEKNKNG